MAEKTLNVTSFLCLFIPKNLHQFLGIQQLHDDTYAPSEIIIWEFEICL